MIDSALWISSLTAGTAVLASWVTSSGTSRAAQIQASATERIQRTAEVRDARKSAYVSLIGQAHRMAELYWTVSDTLASGLPRGEQLPALKEVRTSLREEYGKLRHSIWVIYLEGPDEVAAAAEELRLATRPPYRALEQIITGGLGAGATFEECYDPFWNSVLSFVAAARSAVHEL
ncbi:hypothetical protein [Streptomyces sp. NPDC050738]|uniref:hypothetical protein n=1 Tax=Streptomyces sp. NPDC050738 TaxID=3154744 RepID=UPI0034327284